MAAASCEAAGGPPALSASVGLGDDGVRDRLAGHLPQGDEAIDGGGEADGEDAVVAGGARRFVVEIERAVVAVAAQQNEHVQPVERIHQADADIDVVLQTVAVVDVEVPQLAGEQGAGQGGAGGCAPHQLVQILGIQSHHFGMG